MTDVYDFLEHHGVKGQKWGVRKKVHSVGKALNKQANANTAHTEAVRKTIEPTRAELRKNVGSKAGREILKKNKSKTRKDILTSLEFKNGREWWLVNGALFGATVLFGVAAKKMG